MRADDPMSKITVTVSGETGSGKSAIAGEIEIALKAIGVPVLVQARDTMVVADYQHWIDLYKPEVTIFEQNIPIPAPQPELAMQHRPLDPMSEARLLSGDEQINVIRELVALFNDQGAMVGDAEDIGSAVNRAYEVLSHAALLHPEQEAIAKLLWHRFGDSSVEEWEDETHKAEFLEAADDVLFRARCRSPEASTLFRITIHRGKMSANNEVQASYDLAREDKDLTAVTITRVFENGFKVLAHLYGEDAEAFIDAWNARSPQETSHG
jgi:hypothetical protein